MTTPTDKPADDDQAVLDEYQRLGIRTIPLSILPKIVDILIEAIEHPRLSSAKWFHIPEAQGGCTVFIDTRGVEGNHHIYYLQFREWIPSLRPVINAEDMTAQMSEAGRRIDQGLKTRNANAIVHFDQIYEHLVSLGYQQENARPSAEDVVETAYMPIPAGGKNDE